MKHSPDQKNPRYTFGRNWMRFVRYSFNEQRIKESRYRLLRFLGRDDLAGLTFLDVGCGSGIHSLAAHRSNADQVVSFDIDPFSVQAARMLWQRIDKPHNWIVREGSILDQAFCATLDKANIVYSWGVLHHTEDLWTAIRNAADLVADGGELYLALYRSNVRPPGDQYWLDLKKEYNRASFLKRRIMEIQYLYRFQMGGKLRYLPKLIKEIATYKKSRGMSYFTDMRDWLGGWPMVFSDPKEVEAFVCDLGFRLTKLAVRETNAEYLFAKLEDEEKNG